MESDLDLILNAYHWQIKTILSSGAQFKDVLRSSKCPLTPSFSSVWRGIFGYDDDLVIVSPSIFGLKRIISICKYYADEFDTVFNPKKSKLISIDMLLDVKPSTTLCGQVIAHIS